VRLPVAVKAGSRSALAARDVVALEELLARTPLRSAEHELVLRFPALRGGPEILDAAGGLVRNRRSEQALVELARVRELLVAHGLGAVVGLDLGAIRDFDYYTGVIFEGYGPDLGRPVAHGGRYDRLLTRFGRPAADARARFRLSRSRPGWRGRSHESFNRGAHRHASSRRPALAFTRRRHAPQRRGAWPASPGREVRRAGDPRTARRRACLCRSR